ncbi:helix-turn-helix transcriptional regulator [Methanobrevibacter sp.]|uniref:helix-turn-helix transcriptional regulator n=1 Tax=Methanobrevibacter sp. TaxID=66852 RepID=UPI0038906E6C
MTASQSKNELSEEFKNLKYILTSSMRTKLLLALYNNSKNLDELRNELKKPSATILHGLKELENINLVKKVQKYYKLTSNGYLLTTNLIKLIDNWYSINKSKEFWDSHYLKDIPDEVLKNIYLLKDAQYINSTTSDLSNAFTNYINQMTNAKKLKIILPIYSENHFKQMIKLLNGDKLESLELIVSEPILYSIKRNDFFNNALIKHKKVRINTIKMNIKVFLTCSEDFMALSLFFKDGHYDDSQILIAKDKNALRWANNLFEYYC